MDPERATSSTEWPGGFVRAWQGFPAPRTLPSGLHIQSYFSRPSLSGRPLDRLESNGTVTVNPRRNQ